MIEKEVKIMLTESEYNTICKTFRPQFTLFQRNHYYKCEKNTNLISSIRIREIDERFYLQIKMPIKTKGSLSIKHEYEIEVNSVSEKISSEVLYNLTKTDFGNAHYIGVLETERKLMHPNLSTEICIDKNTYLGKKDYELEIEYTGDYPSEIVQMLINNNINCDNYPEGKYSRFMKEYGIGKGI